MRLFTVLNWLQFAEISSLIDKIHLFKSLFDWIMYLKIDGEHLKTLSYSSLICLVPRVPGTTEVSPGASFQMSSPLEIK